MKTRILLITLFIFTLSLFGQVPKTVLLEYATNASCPPCAAYNPGNYSFLKSNYGSMVAIWYHAWWPGSGDPMYVANKPENENRIGYYNINGVPNYVLNGVSTGGYITSDLIADATPLLKLESPVKLKVESKIIGDSLEVTLTMVVYGAVTQENLKLQTVITESMLTYPSPPGSNGEVEFPHVFRKFIGGVDGIDISQLNIGDSLTYVVKDEIDADWNRNVLAVVGFLQSQSSKEVVQAAMDKRLHAITSEIPSLELISKNQAINYPLSVTNSQADILDLVIKLDVFDNFQNWEANLLKDGNAVDSIVVSLATGESSNFELAIQAGDTPDYIKLAVLARNSSGFVATKDYLALIKAGDVLLIDDDGGMNFNENFERALLNKSTDYTKVNHEILKEIKEIFDMPNDFKSILWNIGSHSPTVENSDFTWILSYLNAGGRILFSGSNFADDIHNVQRSTTGQFFFRNYLDVNFTSDSVTSRRLTSVPNNPLFDTLTIRLDSLHGNVSEGVKSRNGDSHMVMKFDGSDNYGLILREKNSYKTAYITFGLEQISSEATQDLVVDKILDWFATPVVGVEDAKENKIAPTSFNLDQNYPNPFNPSTVISYHLPKSSDIKIIIYDVLGNVIANLVDENQSAGSYSVTFNTSEMRKLTSGIYCYSMLAGDYYQVKKMLLLK